MLVGKPDRKRQLQEDNIQMHLKEIGYADVDWIKRAQSKDQWPTLVNKVPNLRTP
jgi:hypothetical protein